MWSPQLGERFKDLIRGFERPYESGEGRGIAGFTPIGLLAARECEAEFGDALDPQVCAFGIRGTQKVFKLQTNPLGSFPL